MKVECHTEPKRVAEDGEVRWEIKANEDVIEAYLGTSMKNMGEALPG